MVDFLMGPAANIVAEIDEELNVKKVEMLKVRSNSPSHSSISSGDKNLEKKGRRYGVIEEDDDEDERGGNDKQLANHPIEMETYDKEREEEISEDIQSPEKATGNDKENGIIVEDNDEAGRVENDVVEDNDEAEMGEVEYCNPDLQYYPPPPKTYETRKEATGKSKGNGKGKKKKREESDENDDTMENEVSSAKRKPIEFAESMGRKTTGRKKN